MNFKELAEAMCRYDLDDMDLYWLQQLNTELGVMGKREDACKSFPVRFPVRNVTFWMLH